MPLIIHKTTPPRGGSRKLWVGGSSFCVIKGEALVRGTKSREGGGYGKGVTYFMIMIIKDSIVIDRYNWAKCDL